MITRTHLIKGLYLFTSVFREKNALFEFIITISPGLAHISITVLAGTYQPLFQPTFLFNSAFENNSSD
jgi:hypothetical protein